MTIVNRWYNILEKMVSQPTYSLVDMRSELDISMQTLQKSIQQLNDVLAGSSRTEQDYHGNNTSSVG